MQQLADVSIQSGQILGSLGTGGAALGATTYLILGCRSKGRIKLSDDAASITGFVAGTLYASAASFWTAPKTITDSVVASVSGADGPFGNVGLGAVAVVLSLLAYGTAWGKGKKAALGVAGATVFAEAGGIWGIAPVLVTSVVGKTLGVH
ncbi:hypothetical protein [Kitasatospora sp. NPDC001175]|uniref:hypothetical protein n=1 Tax=Kitasatospora sp. NPDC001175 TaxID=3157103 RepID=UPI003CFCF875